MPAADPLRRYVERFAMLLADAGMPRMPSRVFAALLVEDDGELTAGELADRLGVSPAAVSGAVRYLIQVRMIERQREPGRRSDHYAIRNGDQWAEIIVSRQAVMDAWQHAMREGIDLVGSDTPAGRRLAESEAFFAFLREEMPAML